jgi:hypothetical protein
MVFLLLMQPVFSFAYSARFILASGILFEEEENFCEKIQEPKTCCFQESKAETEPSPSLVSESSCCSAEESETTEEPKRCCEQEGRCEHSCCRFPIPSQNSHTIILSDLSLPCFGSQYSDIEEGFSEICCSIPAGYSGDSWRPPRQI